ncbi:MAG: hypothetical protein JRN67_11035, partial [Nitrososphaerota archaeon]|nr:hypothetical protein [Nitrososphaerota archaeon]
MAPILLNCVSLSLETQGRPLQRRMNEGLWRKMNSTNYKGFENDSLIISVEEASKLLGNRNVIFIDTRNYWKYTKGHIPGAYDLEL